MRKIYLCMVIFLICSVAQAQYKKASFLNKSGRTYDLGGIGHFLSGGAGTFPGIYYSYGRDQGKRTFQWFDLEVILPTKFSYNTVDKNNPRTAVTVTSKSALLFLYRYNFAYYLNNPENSESKFKPFVTAGVNIKLKTFNPTDYELKPANTEPAKIADFTGFSMGVNAGIGGIYALTEKFGIKVMAGYNLQYQKNPDGYSAIEGYTIYKVYANHPYVGLGIRFTINGDGE